MVRRFLIVTIVSTDIFQETIYNLLILVHARTGQICGRNSNSTKLCYDLVFYWKYLAYLLAINRLYLQIPFPSFLCLLIFYFYLLSSHFLFFRYPCILGPCMNERAKKPRRYKQGRIFLLENDLFSLLR